VSEALHGMRIDTKEIRAGDYEYAPADVTRDIITKLADELDRWRNALKTAVYGTSKAGDENTPEQFADAICAERGARNDEADKLRTIIRGLSA